MLSAQAIVWAESAPELNRNDDALMEASMANKTTEILTDAAENALKYCLEARVGGSPDKVDDFENWLINVTTTIEQGVPLSTLFEEGVTLNYIQTEIAPVIPKEFTTISSAALEIVDSKVLNEHTEECEKSVKFVWGLLLQATPRLSQLSDPNLS